MEKRTRNWSCIIYPRQGVEGEQTECPEDWAEILGTMGVKCAVSPLHDRDVKPDGTTKKPHRHVVFAYDGVKTEKQAREDFAKIGGVGCEAVRSLYSITRYLTHKDDPDKAQYSSVDVLTFGGFEYKRYVETKEDEEKEVVSKMGQIFNLVAEYELFDFSVLAEYLMTEAPELFSVMRKNSYFFAQFLKCKRELWERFKAAEVEERRRGGV